MALSNVLGLSGAMEAAYLETERSVRVGPRHQAAQWRAARVFGRRWQLTGEPESLRRSLQAVLVLQRMGETGSGRGLIAAMRTRADPAFDVQEAVGEKTELLRLAAALLRSVRPESSDALLAAASRVGDASEDGE